MKKIIPYLLLVLTIISLILIIVKDKKKVIPKLITLDSLHSYLYNANQQISITIYTNDSKAPLDDLRTYKSLKVVSSDQSKSISLNLNTVTYSHNEYFMSEYFYCYQLNFNMPNLTNDFYIEEASLEMILENNNKYLLSIGSFSLTYLSDYSELDWNSLDSKKNNQDDYSLAQVLIELKNDININNIYIGSNNQVNYQLNKNILIINLPNNNLIINNIPIIIQTTDNQYYVIYNYQYVIEYDLLNLSKPLVNIYDFS